MPLGKSTSIMEQKLLEAGFGLSNLSAGVSTAGRLLGVEKLPKRVKASPGGRVVSALGKFVMKSPGIKMAQRYVQNRQQQEQPQPSAPPPKEKEKKPTGKVVLKRVKRRRKGPEAWSRHREAQPPTEPEAKKQEKPAPQPQQQAPVYGSAVPTKGEVARDIIKQAFTPEPGAWERQKERTAAAAGGVVARAKKLTRPVTAVASKVKSMGRRGQQESLDEKSLTKAERREYVKLVAKKSPWPGKKELVRGGAYMMPVPIPGAGVPVAVALKQVELRKQARENVRHRRSASRAGKIAGLTALGLIAKGMKEKRKKKKKEDDGE